MQNLPCSDSTSSYAQSYFAQWHTLILCFSKWQYYVQRDSSYALKLFCTTHCILRYHVSLTMAITIFDIMYKYGKVAIVQTANQFITGQSSIVICQSIYHC